MYMKRYLFVLLFLMVTLFFSCKSTSKKKAGSDISKVNFIETVNFKNQWLDDNTYVLSTIGAWDRTRYYQENKEEVDDKEARSLLLLRNDAKIAAGEKAKRDFLEQVVGSKLESYKETENGKLIIDKIKSEVVGYVPSPIPVKADYIDTGDVQMTYKFQAKNLRKIVTKTIEKILKLQQQNQTK